MSIIQRVTRDIEVGDLWEEQRVEERESFFEVENQRYQRIGGEDAVAGDYILTVDGRIKRILAIPPIGGYTGRYFQTQPDTEKRIGKGYLESQVLKYGRLVTDITAN
jgi:hypothetical protein